MDNNVHLSLWKRFWGHLATVHHHRALVRKYCFRCGLYWQGLVHDLSKYNPQEFIPSVRYFQGNRSPYAYEKELYGIAPGWLHHKGHNKHHWEYWTDCIKGKWVPMEMPEKYIVESFCDRIAASQTYKKEQYTDDAPLAYFQRVREGGLLAPRTERELEGMLTMLAEKGEDETFRVIRECLKKHTGICGD